MGADHVFDLDGDDRRRSGWRSSARCTHGEGADVVIEAAGSAARDRRGPGAGARRRTLRRSPATTRTSGRRADQRAPAHQPQASRDPRLLGQRAGPLPARAGAPRASRGARPLARDRRAHVSAHRLNEALADAEAMRITKALVDPWSTGSSRSEPANRDCRCRLRHTKIVATRRPGLQPARNARALLGAGVDVFRLNFSHGTHESHAEDLSRRSARPPRRPAGTVAVMQDLSGPKIRTGPLEGGEPLMLEPRRDAAHRRRRRTGEPAESSSRRTQPLIRVGQPRRSAAARRWADRAAGRGAAARRDRDVGRQRRAARAAQGHQRAGRGAAGLGGHRQGRRRPAVRPRVSASTWSR